MEELAAIFRALSDKTRLRIVFSLLRAGRALCVCEIMDALALPQYKISRHMRELKITGLVRERKEGRFVFYALRTPGDKAHGFLLKALDSFDRAAFAVDNRRLKKRLALRIGGKCVAGIRQGCC